MNAVNVHLEIPLQLDKNCAYQQYTLACIHYHYLFLEPYYLDKARVAKVWEYSIFKLYATW